MVQRLRQILVATDLSREAGLALERAGRLAQEHGARLTLVHVAPATGRRAARSDRILRAVIPQLHSVVAETAAKLGRAFQIRCASVLARGEPAALIARTARRFEAELIVLGAHGSASVLDQVIGTTADRVLRLSAAPVLVVRTHARVAYAEVLVPSDDSPAAHAAARFAARAFPTGRFLMLAVVNAPFEGFLMRYGADAQLLAAHRRSTAREAEARLRALAAQAGIAERASLRVERGYVPAQILRRAGELGDGVIAMGAYGRNPLAAKLLGGVSVRVAAGAPCDVLLVRPARRARGATH